jgi:flagellar export protein FliJ
MNDPARLEPLSDYAVMRETEAAQRLAASARALKAKEAEVQQLRGYLAEYRQRAELADRSTDAARWQNARAFLTKLSDAVAFHEAELQKSIERYRLEADRWRLSHQRAVALDKVLERAEQAAREALQKRDQAELDERALRHSLRSRS